MFRSRLTAIALIIACAALAVGCGRGGTGGDGSQDSSRLTIVAGFYPLAELAEKIGGQAVDVVNLTPAGAEAHDLELTPSQVDAVLDADLVLFVGGFQPALEEAAAQRGEGGSLDLGGASDGDPHFWLSPLRLAADVPKVRNALTALEPTRERQFQRGGSMYGAALSTLHQEFAAGLAECDQRTFITTHDAFGQLAEAYDLRQESIAGLSPESEPDPARLADLADRIEQLGVTTVFVEPLAPRGAAETLAREADVTIAELDPLESLRPGSDDDYSSVMRRNLAALRSGLVCR